MAQIYFYLNTQKTNKNGESPILMMVTFNNERVRKSVGKRCMSKHWIDEKGLVKANTKAESSNNHQVINNEIDKFRNKANDIIKHASLNDEELDKEYFEREWNNRFGKHGKAKSLIDYFEEYIEIQTPLRAERTIKGHVTALNLLKEYCSEKKVTIKLDKFDYDKFERFRDYCFREREFSDNYFSTLVKRIKAVMNWALIKGYHTNRKFQNFTAPERPKEIVCLYEEELFKLYHYEFSNSRLERVRDMYCFGCFTGLRFSDLIDLKREHLIDDEIQKVIVKTKEFQRIPLNKYAIQILEKYGDQAMPLPKISQQKFNSYLKEACKVAEIDSLVSVTSFSGGAKKQETIPKWKLITSHTARKTFTTNSLIFGMSESAVKKITGHKKDDNFKKYVRLADSYIKDQAKAAWDR